MFLKECKISKTSLPSKSCKKISKIKNQSKIFKLSKAIATQTDLLQYKIYLPFQIKKTVRMLIIILKSISLLPVL